MDEVASAQQPSETSFMSESTESPDIVPYPGQPLSYATEASSRLLSDSTNDYDQQDAAPIGLGLTYAESQLQSSRYVSSADFLRTSSYPIETTTPLPISAPFVTDVTSYPIALGGHSYSHQQESEAFFSSSHTAEFVEVKPLSGAESSVPNQPLMADQYRSSQPYSSERNLYTGAVQHFGSSPDRSELQALPSFPGYAREEQSPSVSGSSSSPRNFSSFGGENHDAPPFNAMQPAAGVSVHHSGQVIEIDLHAKVEKGFFIAPDNEWTCYRRNYFGVNCSFSLSPHHRLGSYEIETKEGVVQHAIGFVMAISASVDSEKGKVVELIQHTPKRDKGPQTRPTFVALQPRVPPSSTMYGSYGGIGPSALYSPIYESPGMQQQVPTEHAFERIQFKQATANNGKRRAAQQYYHVIVTLYADVGAQADIRYVKLASRSSAPLVVRGRSPGHYQDARANPRTESEGSSIFGGIQYPRIGMAEQRMLPGLSGSPSYLHSNGYEERGYGRGYEPRTYDDHHYTDGHGYVAEKNGAYLETPATPSYSEAESQIYDRQMGYTYHQIATLPSQSYTMGGGPVSTGPYTPGTAVYMPPAPGYSMSPPPSVYRDDRSGSFASTGSLAPYNPGLPNPASPRLRLDMGSRDLPLPQPVQPFDRFNAIAGSNNLPREYYATPSFASKF